MKKPTTQNLIATLISIIVAVCTVMGELDTGVCICRESNRCDLS